jgi:hypothetical protein
MLNAIVKTILILMFIPSVMLMYLIVKDVIEWDYK